jgi:hypothetical protein
MKQLIPIQKVRKNVSIQRIGMGGGLVACLVFSLALAIRPAHSDKPDGTVHALFNLHHPETGPFPSDIFTVADPTHNTGHRVNLPYPDCAVHVSDCKDLDVINTLDGFGLQTRLSIPFDGSIDVNTATAENVFLISLGSTLDRGVTRQARLSASIKSCGTPSRIRCTSRPTSCSRNTLATRSSSPIGCEIPQGGLSRRARAFAGSGRRCEESTSRRCSRLFTRRGASAYANAT